MSYFTGIVNGRPVNSLYMLANPGVDLLNDNRATFKAHVTIPFLAAGEPSAFSKKELVLSRYQCSPPQPPKMIKSFADNYKMFSALYKTCGTREAEALNAPVI